MKEQRLHAMPGIVLPREAEAVGPSGANSGVGSGTKSSSTRVRDDPLLRDETCCARAYLDFFLAERNLLNKFQTRCLVRLWVAFICLFQDRLILSATALIRDGSKRFHLLPECTSSSFVFV
jgi:hypothetical protein